jgi:hypothetical protein
LTATIKGVDIFVRRVAVKSFFGLSPSRTSTRDWAALLCGSIKDQDPAKSSRRWSMSRLGESIVTPPPLAMSLSASAGAESRRVSLLWATVGVEAVLRLSGVFPKRVSSHL